MIRRYTFIILYWFAGSVLACGSAEHLFSMYSSEMSLTEKTNFLNTQVCSDLLSYRPHQADPVIARVLIDAIDSGVEPEVIKKVLKNYNCAYGAREQADYHRIINYIGQEQYAAFCNTELLDKNYVVDSDNGVVLREGPDKNSQRLSGIPDGYYLGTIKEVGDWVYVDTYYGKGYVYKPLLKKY